MENSIWQFQRSNAVIVDCMNEISSVIRTGLCFRHTSHLKMAQKKAESIYTIWSLFTEFNIYAEVIILYTYLVWLNMWSCCSYFLHILKQVVNCKQKNFATQTTAKCTRYILDCLVQVCTSMLIYVCQATTTQSHHNSKTHIRFLSNHGMVSGILYQRLLPVLSEIATSPWTLNVNPVYKISLNVC